MTTASPETGATIVEQPAPPKPRRRPRRSIWERIPRFVTVPLFAAFLVLLWQCAVWFEWASGLVLPPPADVARETADIVGSIVSGEYVWDSLWVTTKEIIIGLVLAAIAGISLGVISAETAFGRQVLQPFLVGLYAAPKVAFAPIFVAWLGFDIWPKVLMVVVIAFFPLLVDTAAGLAALDPNQDKLFRSMRASRRQTFLKLKLNNALPFVFAGLKTASVLAVIGAIVGEFLGGGTGLGAQIRISSSRLAMDRVFAYVIVLSVMAYVLYAIVAIVERHVVFWRKTGFVPDGIDI
ncbi:MAG: ABC transporter permease [Candidatus Limnocylindria bacterium]